jgi:fucose permease
MPSIIEFMAKRKFSLSYILCNQIKCENALRHSKGRLVAIAAKSQSKFIIIFLAYVAFISLGLPDGLLGVAYPSMRETFGLPLDALGTLIFSATLGYMLSSFNSGRIVTNFGVGKLLALSCLMTGTALIGYTVAPTWFFILIIGIFAGMGAGAIDAGLNTYIAANHSPSLMYWLHASFGIGITLGPLIITTGLDLTSSWRTGYIVVGVAQIILAVCFFITANRWRGSTEEEHITRRVSMGSTLRLPVTWLSILLFIVYCGGEVIAGQWAYTLLTDSRSITPTLAGLWVAAYWGSFTAGRLTAGFIAKRFTTRQVMRFSMTGAVIGAVFYLWNPVPFVSLFGLMLVGFAFAPIFPSLISTSYERVGREHAANLIGFQVTAASAGIMLLPWLTGVLAKDIHIEMIAVMLLFTSVIMFGVHEIIILNRKVKRDA